MGEISDSGRWIEPAIFLGDEVGVLFFEMRKGCTFTSVSGSTSQHWWGGSAAVSAFQANAYLPAQ